MDETSRQALIRDLYCNALEADLDGRAEEAASFYREAIRLGNSPPKVLAAYADFLENEGRLEEAEEYYRKSLPGGTLEEIASRRLSLAHVLYKLGSYAQARREAEGLEGEDAIELRAFIDMMSGNLDGAAAGFERLIAIRDPEGLPAAAARLRLGVVRTEQSRMAEAEQLFRWAYETRMRLLGENHEDTLDALDKLTGIL